MKKLLGCLLFSFFPVSNVAASAVQVEFDHETIGFAEQPRVSVLLQVLNNKSKVYWPMAKLYQTDTDNQAQLLQNQRQVLEDLRQLIIIWHHDQSVSQQLSALRREIASWQLGVLVNTPLDLDLAKLKQEFNPVLNKGIYTLSASKRLNFVSVVAMGGRSDVVYRQGKPAYQYLAEADFSAASKDVDEVFYIPNQTYNNTIEIKTIAVSFWNKTAEPVANGTVLFVPVPVDVLTEQYATLNEQIVQLAQYRIAQ